MTELTTLKDDELEEINGGFWPAFAAGYALTEVINYGRTEMSDPNHYLGKPDYRTWLN
ncbi:class IIb bacteriocin, lactobin A/cerein 7B family [Clostridium sp.]